MWKLALVIALLLTAAAAPSARAATCTPPTAGRVALWQGEDTAADSAGDFDGVLFGDAAYRDGKVGRAFSFPGDQDHMRVPSATGLEVTGDVTLDAWVKLDDTNFEVGGDRAIFFKSDADDQELTYALWIEGSDVTADAAPITFAAGDRSVPGSHAYSDPLAWKADTWYHVAGVRSGRDIHFYRDGVPVGTDTLGQDGIATPDAWLALGAAPVGDTVFNPLKGALDEAGIWNRALSADEIATLGGHCGPRTRITAGPANGDEIKGDPTFSFESSEPVSTFHCFVRFPPGTIVPSKSFDCSSPTKLALGPAGTYTFHVAAEGDPTGDQRTFRLLPPPPRNTARPSIVPLGDHTYRCDPGAWEGTRPRAPLYLHVAAADARHERVQRLPGRHRGHRRDVPRRDREAVRHPQRELAVPVRGHGGQRGWIDERDEPLVEARPRLRPGPRAAAVRQLPGARDRRLPGRAAERGRRDVGRPGGRRVPRRVRRRDADELEADPGRVLARARAPAVQALRGRRARRPQAGDRDRLRGHGRRRAPGRSSRSACA